MDSNNLDSTSFNKLDKKYIIPNEHSHSFVGQKSQIKLKSDKDFNNFLKSDVEPEHENNIEFDENRVSPQELHLLQSVFKSMPSVYILPNKIFI